VFRFALSVNNSNSLYKAYIKRISNVGQSVARRRKYNSHAETREANRIKARIRGKVVRNNKPVLLPQYLFAHKDSRSKGWEAEGLTDMRAKLRIHYTICTNEVKDNRHDLNKLQSIRNLFS
jgi:hypothetical protein